MDTNLGDLEYQLDIANEHLDDIEETLEHIVYNQEILISGDNMIIKNQEEIIISVYTIAVIVGLYVLFYYIVRCLK